MQEQNTLKFRGFNGGKMRYFGEGSVTMNYDKHMGMFFPLLSEKFSMGRFEIMQFTGFSDKNDKIVYDCDIIRWVQLPGKQDDLTSEVRKVKWLFGGWYAVSDEHDIPIELGRELVDGERLAEWEVIGNIHENPDLLDMES